MGDGEADTQWSTDLPSTEWNVSYSSIGMSQLATEYILIPVSATKAGVAYNPTGDTVQFAFMPNPTYRNSATGKPAPGIRTRITFCTLFC